MNALWVMLWLLIALATWQIIGCMVLAYLDLTRTNGRLIEWAEKSPLPGWGIAAMLWPWVLWKVITEPQDAAP